MYQLLFLSTLLTSCSGSTESRREQEADKLLKQLNKPFIKSIQSSDGDIIDCVLLHKQPSLDHPLLKGHIVQMSATDLVPSKMSNQSSDATAKSRKNTLNTVHQLWQLNGTCPRGTVPIRRTKKEDILRAPSIKSYGTKYNKIDNQQHEYAVAYVDKGTYYGTQASINVWKPNVEENNDMSIAQIWVMGGGKNSLSYPCTVEAGWQVLPSLYGDHNTRFFVYYTPDQYQDGYYNQEHSSGFVQLSKNIAVGATISHVSIYGDRKKQYVIRLSIFKGKSGWCLKYFDELIGYWPFKLFGDNKFHDASAIEWGGEISYPETSRFHTTTQMGSGHFPREGFGGASYFRNIQVYKDYSGKLQDPGVLSVMVPNANCYDLELGSNLKWGRFFYFGGPGRNDNCP